MRIAIMGRSIRPGLTGVGGHVLGLVHGLAEANPNFDLTVFLTTEASRFTQPNVLEARAPFATPNEYARAFWEQTVVPWQARCRGIDLYHSPNYILPAALTTPSVVTIHDLTFLDEGLHRWTSHHYLRTLVALAIRKARAIIAVSEYTRARIEQRYPEAQGRVRVIYQGLKPGLGVPGTKELESFLTERRMERPYVLFVGTIEPRKNVPRLIEGFEQAVLEAGLPHHLYLVGQVGWKAAGVREALARCKVAPRVHLAGYVPDEDLPYYYAGADVFVYPSLEEGFGLPPAEAMACGAPVITSDCSSLPEAVGDAALKVDPHSRDALASAIASLLRDAPRRATMRAAGLLQAQRFSWSRAAREHLQLYEAVAGGA